jgi:hypothetical protein
MPSINKVLPYMIHDALIKPAYSCLLKQPTLQVMA